MNRAMLMQRKVEGDILENWAEEFESENPELLTLPDLMGMTLQANTDELLVAYFAEVKNDKSRKITDIREYADRVACLLNSEPLKIQLIDFSFMPEEKFPFLGLPSATLDNVGRIVDPMANLEQMRKRSRLKAKELRKKIGLETISDTDGFSRLEGLLKKYSKPGDNAVSLIREVREEK